MQEIFRSYVVDGWLMRCTRRACLLSHQSPGFLVEHDLWQDAELAENPIYRDFLRPRGLGWSAGTALPMPTRDTIIFSLERDYQSGPVEPNAVAQLNSLRPHLARSAFVAARLKLQQAKGATDTLAAMGLPAVVLGADGAIVAANDLAEAEADFAVGRAGAALTLADGKANTLLKDALATPDGPHGRAVKSIPLRDKTGRARQVIHLVPIHGAARDLFTRSLALLIFTPVAAPKAPKAELLRSLFDLTPAEAALARALIGGDTLDQIATRTGVAITTVRTHLRGVLQKTGCRRQAELVLLLGNIALERGSAH
jgi:DNA-binding CsgD family transcriptional regulator